MHHETAGTVWILAWGSLDYVVQPHQPSTTTIVRDDSTGIKSTGIEIGLSLLLSASIAPSILQPCLAWLPRSAPPYQAVTRKRTCDLCIYNYKGFLFCTRHRDMAAWHHFPLTSSPYLNTGHSTFQLSNTHMRPHPMMKSALLHQCPDNNLSFSSPKTSDKHSLDYLCTVTCRSRKFASPPTQNRCLHSISGCLHSTWSQSGSRSRPKDGRPERSWPAPAPAPGCCPPS